MDTKELARKASQTRRDIVRMVAAVNSGHPGGSLGCTDFLTVLYNKIMKHDPSNFTMDGKNEDLLLGDLNFLYVKRIAITITQIKINKNKIIINE